MPIKDPIRRKEYDARYFQEKKQASPLYARQNRLKSLYKMSVEQFDELFEQQNGLCYLCSEPTRYRESPPDSRGSCVTLFTGASNVYGRNVYNSSTAVCYLSYGTVASSSVYTLQVAANTNYAFPAPTYSGAVTATWLAVNGTAYTTLVMK